jgi:hypothetical protein
MADGKQWGVGRFIGLRTLVWFGALPVSAANPAHPVMGDYSVLSVSAWDATGILLTDPSEHRVGFDPTAHKTYAEIPNAHYDDNLGIGDAVSGEPPKAVGRQVEITPAASGTYRLRIWTTAKTGADLEVDAADTTQVNATTVSLGDLKASSPGGVVLTITYDSKDIKKLIVTNPAALAGANGKGRTPP